MDSVTSVVGPSGRWIRAASFLPFAALAAVYGPAAGHGFIADDFRWILESRTSGLRDAAALFSKSFDIFEFGDRWPAAMIADAIKNHPRLVQIIERIRSNAL